MLDLTFGEQVKIILSRKGMTIKELAEIIEERTGKKMSRQNLTQRLGRDNFQEQDMRMIADILECPFRLSILADSEAVERASNIGDVAPTEKELSKLAKAKARKEKKAKAAAHLADAMEKIPSEKEGAAAEKELTIGDYIDIHEALERQETGKLPRVTEDKLQKAEPEIREKENRETELRETENREQEIREAECMEPEVAESVTPEKIEERVQEDSEVEVGVEVTAGEPEHVDSAVTEPEEESHSDVQEVLRELEEERIEEKQREEMRQEEKRQERQEEKRQEERKVGGWRALFQRRSKKERQEELKEEAAIEQEITGRASGTEEAYIEPEEPQETEWQQEVTETRTEYTAETVAPEYTAEAMMSEEILEDDDEAEDLVRGEVNPYTRHEYESNSVRMHPKRIGYVQVYDRKDHAWTDMTEWAFLGYQERKKALLGKDYEPPIYLD